MHTCYPDAAQDMLHDASHGRDRSEGSPVPNKRTEGGRLILKGVLPQHGTACGASTSRRLRRRIDPEVKAGWRAGNPAQPCVPCATLNSGYNHHHGRGLIQQQRPLRGLKVDRTTGSIRCSRNDAVSKDGIRMTVALLDGPMQPRMQLKMAVAKKQISWI